MSAEPSFADPAFGRVAVTTIAVGDIDEKVVAAEIGAGGWQSGPLPLRLLGPGDEALTANTKARATYLDEHVVSSVLGGAGVGRVHRLVLPTLRTPSGARIWAVEVVELTTLGAVGGTISAALGPGGREHAGTVPAPRFAVLVHATVEHDGRSSAQVLAGVRSVALQALPAKLGLRRFRTAEHRGRSEAFRLVMATPSQDALPGPSQLGLRNPTDATDPEQFWAFFLASATLPKSVAGGLVPDFDVDGPTLAAELDEDSFLPLSADWRAGVLRDGAGFVGMRADGAAGRGELWVTKLDAVKEDFYDSAELYVRTLYADIFVLGVLQRQALLRLRACVLAAGRAEERTSVARAVEFELAAFREQFWWSDVSRGGAGDRLLAAYHHENGLQELYDQVERNAASLTDRVRLSGERGRVGALALIGLTSLLSLVLTMARFVLPSSASRGELVAWLLGCVGVSMSVVGVLLGVFRHLRHAARDAFRR